MTTCGEFYPGRKLRPIAEILQPLVAVVTAQEGDDGFQVALDEDLLQVEVGVEAVVGDPVLGVVVGADALVPVSRADLVAADTLLLLGALRLQLVIESRAEDLHRLGAVLVLGGLVLDSY